MYEGIDEQNSTECLEHHGILGMKWFKKNGPPYPLDSGDHSAGEKAAAKAAGVSVGSDSGKGSIENVKKKKSKPKKELTPEEKRAAALDAASKGDKKKIAKNMDQLTTDELRDAKNRAELRDALSKSDPDKKSKADKEKEEAIKSGDKATIQAYASKMTYNELAEAMNKMNLMAQLNHVDPPPTAMDKLKKAAEAAGKFKDAAEKGIGAYNQVAKVINAINKDTKWPIIGEKPKEEKKEDKDKEKEQMKEGAKKVIEGVTKSYEEQAKEKFKNAKTDYKYDKKLEDWKAKQDARRAKGEDIEDDDDDTPARSNSSPSQSTSTESKASTSETSRKYTPEKAPILKKTYFNTKKEEPAKSTEPTEEQKRLLESERKKDAEYLNQMKMTTKAPSFDEIFSESYKESQRNMSFEKAMEEYDWQDAYDYYMRHSEV